MVYLYIPLVPGAFLFRVAQFASISLCRPARSAAERRDSRFRVWLSAVIHAPRLKGESTFLGDT